MPYEKRALIGNADHYGSEKQRASLSWTRVTNSTNTTVGSGCDMTSQSVPFEKGEEKPTSSRSYFEQWHWTRGRIQRIEISRLRPVWERDATCCGRSLSPTTGRRETEEFVSRRRSMPKVPTAKHHLSSYESTTQYISIRPHLRDNRSWEIHNLINHRSRK
jgi:hypothetical protein